MSLENILESVKSNVLGRRFEGNSERNVSSVTNVSDNILTFLNGLHFIQAATSPNPNAPGSYKIYSMEILVSPHLPSSLSLEYSSTCSERSLFALNLDGSGMSVFRSAAFIGYGEFHFHIPRLFSHRDTISAVFQLSDQCDHQININMSTNIDDLMKVVSLEYSQILRENVMSLLLFDAIYPALFACLFGYFWDL
eukprot:232384_1